MVSYRQDKGNYVFYNANPKKLLSSSDCVIRAISKALNKSWEDVYMDLVKIGLETKAMPSQKKTFEKYLNELGYATEKQPRKEDNTKYTADEFAKKNKKGIYIINLANHLSVLVDGKIYDTWNCSRKCVGNYWKVK
jgi:hypothetical protein